jgi:hypothetical protein
MGEGKRQELVLRQEVVKAVGLETGGGQLKVR